MASRLIRPLWCLLLPALLCACGPEPIPTARLATWRGRPITVEAVQPHHMRIDMQEDHARAVVGPHEIWIYPTQMTVDGNTAFDGRTFSGVHIRLEDKLRVWVDGRKVYP